MGGWYGGLIWEIHMTSLTTHSKKKKSLTTLNIISHLISDLSWHNILVILQYSVHVHIANSVPIKTPLILPSLTLLLPTHLPIKIFPLPLSAFVSSSYILAHKTDPPPHPPGIYDEIFFF